jgi:hypothetical protein
MGEEGIHTAPMAARPPACCPGAAMRRSRIRLGRGSGLRAGACLFKDGPPVPPKFSPELQRRITEAREQLAVAERELEAALSELKVSERADKKMISERLEIAFAKLATGRRNLEAILQEED